jgi:hypothetical protein
VCTLETGAPSAPAGLNAENQRNRDASAPAPAPIGVWAFAEHPPPPPRAKTPPPPRTAPVPMSVIGTTGTPALTATLNAPFLNPPSTLSLLRVPSGKNNTLAPAPNISMHVCRHLSWLRRSTRFNLM